MTTALVTCCPISILNTFFAIYLVPPCLFHHNLIHSFCTKYNRNQFHITQCLTMRQALCDNETKIFHCLILVKKAHNNKDMCVLCQSTQSQVPLYYRFTK